MTNSDAQPKSLTIQELHDELWELQSSLLSLTRDGATKKAISNILTRIKRNLSLSEALTMSDSISQPDPTKRKLSGQQVDSKVEPGNPGDGGKSAKKARKSI